MADGARSLAGIGIPHNRIAEALAAFGPGRVRFEIELHADAAWPGLAALAMVAERSGLVLKALRCAPDGRILCKVGVAGRPDLAGFEAVLSTGLTLERWTTIIDV